MSKIRLTEAVIAKLKPPANGDVVYWDAACPTLGLRISKTGRRTWTRSSAGTKTKLGTYPELSLKQARALLADDDAPAPAITFRTLVDRFLERGNQIGRRYCAVCLTCLQWGERTTKRVCSDACRQKAHRLRHAGSWPRRQKLHALHRRCLDRLALASRFEWLRGEFNELCYLRKQGVGIQDPQPVAMLMLEARREQKRADATERTLMRVIQRVR